MKKKKLTILLFGILMICILGGAMWLAVKKIRVSRSSEENRVEESKKEELQPEIPADMQPEPESEEPEKLSGELSGEEEYSIRERNPETIKEHLLQYSNDFEELRYADAYVVVHGKEEWGTAYLENFLESVEQKKPAEMDIVQFTTEGDAILYYLNYNGEDFYMVADYSRDAFKGNGASYEEWTFPYLKIFENTDENGEEYREFYLTKDDTMTLNDVKAYGSGNVSGEKNYLYLMTIVDFVGYYGITDDIRAQLEVFAKTSEEWRYEDKGPYACSYAVYDLDLDGKPELLTKVEVGTGLYSENHFYQVNEAGDGICELEQQLYDENVEFDLEFLEFPAYADGDGTIYYAARNVEKSGYQNCCFTDGFFFLKDGVIRNEAVRLSYYDGNLPEGEQYVYYRYEQEKTVIDQREWEQLYSDYIADMTERKVSFAWFQLEEDEPVSPEELLRLLVTSYKDGIY